MFAFPLTLRTVLTAPRVPGRSIASGQLSAVFQLIFGVQCISLPMAQFSGGCCFCCIPGTYELYVIITAAGLVGHLYADDTGVHQRTRSIILNNISTVNYMC